MYSHPIGKCVVVLRHKIYSVDMDWDMTDNVYVVLLIGHFVLLHCTCSVISINGLIVFVPPRAATHCTCTQHWSCGLVTWILFFILFPFILAEKSLEILNSDENECFIIWLALCIVHCYIVYCTCPAVSINCPIVFAPPQADIAPWPLHLSAVWVCGPG